MFAPGRNCWRIERAERVAFLVDGEEYFGAVRAALAKAQRSFFILGWDIRQPDAPHSRGRERRASGTARRLPERNRRRASRTARLRALVGLRDALRAGARVAADLQARLAHAPAAVVPSRRSASGRRIASSEDRRRRRRGRLRQRLRSDDGALGYLPPREGRPAPCRSSLGKPYPPFHDVGIVVGGDCARALGELARERWRRATGRAPRRARRHAGDPTHGRRASNPH